MWNFKIKNKNRNKSLSSKGSTIKVKKLALYKKMLVEFSCEIFSKILLTKLRKDFIDKVKK